MIEVYHDRESLLRLPVVNMKVGLLRSLTKEYGNDRDLAMMQIATQGLEALLKRRQHQGRRHRGPKMDARASTTRSPPRQKSAQ